MCETADLQQRLDQAESVIQAVRSGQVDAVVGEQDVVLLRLAKVERKLKESEQRLRLALDAGRMGIWDRDLLTGETVCSDRVYDMLGRDPNEPLDEATFMTHVHGEDRDRIERLKRFWARRGGHFQDEFRIIRPNGEVRWLATAGRVDCDAGGRAVRIYGVNQDITDRKRAEEQARQLGDELKTELDAMRRLHETSTRLLGEERPEVLLTAILDGAMMVCAGDAGMLQLVQGDGKTLRMVAHRGLSAGFLHMWTTVTVDDPVACSQSMKSGRRVILGEGRRPEPEPFARTLRDEGVVAMQATPLISRSPRVVGVLSTHWRRAYYPADRDLRLLDLFSRQAADLIERMNGPKHPQET